MESARIRSVHPCTKIALLFLCIVISALLTSIKAELCFVLLIALLGLLNGRPALAFKGFALYLGIYLLTILALRAGSPAVKSMMMPFLGLVHKVYPACFLSGIIIQSTKIGEFLSAMSRANVSQKISIPLAVMLRYAPTIKEDWACIKDSMTLRGLSPSLLGFLRHPGRTVECIYVPMIISASKAADELTIASVTRGIESQVKRTSIIELHFGLKDVLLLAAGLALTAAAIYMRVFQ